MLRLGSLNFELVLFTRLKVIQQEIIHADDLAPLGGARGGEERIVLVLEV